MHRLFIIAGSLLSFVAVALGAFAAHLLKPKLPENLFNIFEVGVRYHFYHSLALFAVAWCIVQFPSSSFTIVGWLFISGIVIFSGSLYVMSLTGIQWLGAITPIGGVCFLSGWLLLAWKVYQSAQQ
ncbi:MAG: DUF423 domain-containing protein [Bacteroidota bacterium]